MELQLIEIGYSAEPARPVPLNDGARMICDLCASMYRRSGFVRPWIGYLAERDGQVVGTCGFKGAPRAGSVEIAYSTFPEFEAHGIATQMARQLIAMARATDASLHVAAQTLPQENASTTILRKLGFVRSGVATDDEVGEVWDWQLPAPQLPFLTTAAQGRAVAVVGDIYRFLATSKETNGAYALWEAIVPPGGGPPLHVHSREQEWFYVLEGEVTFDIGDERHVASTGMFAHLPVGVRHAFRNESAATARLLVSVTPAGLEQMFFEVGMPVAADQTTAAPPTQEEIDRLLAVVPRYGIEVVPPQS